MPKDEKEKFDKLVDTPESNKDEESSFKPKNTDSYGDYHSYNKPLIISLIVLLFIFILIAIGSVAMYARSNMMSERRNTIIYSQQNIPRTRHMFVQTSSTDNTVNTNIVSGVVTSINGGNFVIAGNGNQTNVTTSSNTIYNTTDKKVSVNDSVIVVGTKSNSTITASEVRIVNL